MRGNLLFCPVVIFLCADDKFDFVRGFQMRNVGKMISVRLAAGRTFQIHDAADARINFRNIVRAARFQQNGEAFVAERLHQRQGIFLEQRLAAGEFDQGQ